MKQFMPLALVASALCANSVYAGSNQPELAACADALAPTGQDAAAWLANVQTQAQLEHVFACATVPQTLPTGRGRGWGNIRAASKEWNELQTKIGGALWGGKVFTTEGGKTTLLNLMVDSGTLRYNAEVYSTTSIFDGKATVVLDYRVDTSATETAAATPVQAILDPIIHGVRDEIREVSQKDADSNVHGTGVYVGRAYLYKNFVQVLTDTKISDSEFDSLNDYFLAANFFLDFRTPAQAN